MSAAVLWLIAGLVLIAAEALSGDFYLAPLGVAALAAAGVAVFDPPLWVHVGTFAVVSVALVTVARPALKRRLHPAVETRTGTDALVGSPAVVVATVSDTGGRVKVAGEIWSARSLDATLTFDVGATVTVMKIDGATAVVWASP